MDQEIPGLRYTTSNHSSAYDEPPRKRTRSDNGGYTDEGGGASDADFGMRQQLGSSRGQQRGRGQSQSVPNFQLDDCDRRRSKSPYSGERSSYRSLATPGHEGSVVDRSSTANVLSINWDVALTARPVHESESSRTLIATNIPHRVGQESIRRLFERHGYVYLFEDDIYANGEALVTYFDIRAAIRAYKRMGEIIVGGKKLQVKFHEEARMQAMLKVILRDSKSNIDEYRIRDLFQRYGEIRRISRAPGIQACATTRHIEFFDTRDCIEAQRNLHGHQFQGGTIEVEFVEQLETGTVKITEVGDEKTGVKSKGTKRSHEEIEKDASHEHSETEGGQVQDSLQPPESSNNADDDISERLAQAQKLQRLLSALKPSKPAAQPQAQSFQINASIIPDAGEPTRTEYYQSPQPEIPTYTYIVPNLPTTTVPRYIEHYRSSQPNIIQSASTHTQWPTRTTDPRKRNAK
uniref:RRM domain-containing protein n=1 Tax=Moniliophthora roreri TaxID=221103 RepID=A0A0W0FS56_MONRR